MQSETTNFCQELKSYVQNKSELFKKHEPHDRVTRADGFTAAQAQVIVDKYILLLWKAIQKRVEFTDLTNSPCAYSEAPADCRGHLQCHIKSDPRKRITIS